MSEKSDRSLQHLINGPLGIILLIAITRILPPRVGYWLASAMGKFVASRKNLAMTRAVRSNLWVVFGGNITLSQLDNLTKEVFIRHGRNLYDFYRYVNDAAKIENKVTLDDKFLDCIQISRSRHASQILVMPHFGNFELAARAAALRGLTMQILSYPNPGGSYRWQNKFRNFEGVEVTPISISSLRKALKSLETGGTVFTGIDRPTNESTFRPNFFGRPASLPTGFIRLALKTNTSIRVIICSNLGEKTTLSVTDPLPLVRLPDSDKEEKENAEIVLKQIEALIRSDPASWSMFYPVWPDLVIEPLEHGGFV